jgi:hypothetical protein
LEVYPRILTLLLSELERIFSISFHQRRSNQVKICIHNSSPPLTSRRSDLPTSRSLSAITPTKLGANLIPSSFNSFESGKKLTSTFQRLGKHLERPDLVKPISNTSATITKDDRPQNLSPQRHSAAAKPPTQLPSPPKYRLAYHRDNPATLFHIFHQLAQSHFPGYDLTAQQRRRREIDCTAVHTTRHLVLNLSIDDAGRTRHTPGACLKLSAVPSARMGHANKQGESAQSQRSNNHHVVQPPAEM